MIGFFPNMTTLRYEDVRNIIIDKCPKSLMMLLESTLDLGNILCKHGPSTVG